MIKRFIFVATLGFLAAQVQAQTPAFPTDFPRDAKTPDAKALDELVRGNVFVIKTSAGTCWRLQFQSSGYLFTNGSTGARDSGKWRTEDGRICVEYVGPFPSGCSEIRIRGNAIYFKGLTTGEIYALEKQ